MKLTLIIEDFNDRTHGNVHTLLDYVEIGGDLAVMPEIYVNRASDDNFGPQAFEVPLGGFLILQHPDYEPCYTPEEES